MLQDQTLFTVECTTKEGVKDGYEMQAAEKEG